MNKTTGSAYLMSARLATIALQFLAIPLYLHIVGASGYGLVILVTNWRAWAGVLDLDAPVGALNLQARRFGIGWNEGLAVHRTTLGMHLAIGLLGCFALSVFGPFLPVAKGAIRGANWYEMFALAGFQFLFEYLSNGINIAYMARQQFRRIAGLSTLVSFCGVLVSVPAVIVFRTPIAVAAGTTFGALAGLLANIVLVRRYEPDLILTPQFDPAIAKEILKLGSKNYLNNCLGRVGKTADKLVLGSTLGLTAVGFYATCTKIPELISDLLSRISDSALPEMAKRAHEPDEEFSKLVRRNVLIIGTVAASTLPLICAFGPSLLRLWQGASFDAKAGGPIVVAMGVYYTFEMVYGMLARTLLSRDRMLHAIPFVAFNALVTVFGTGPISQRFGLVGVAWMNVAIDIAQFVPFVMLVFYVVAPAASGREVALRAGTIMITGFGLAALMFWMDSVEIGSRLALLAVPAIPGAIWLTLKVLVSARLAVTPDSLQRVLRRFDLAVRT